MDLVSLSRLFSGIKSDSRETGSDHFLSSLSLFRKPPPKKSASALFSFDELHELLTKKKEKRMETIYNVLLYPSLRKVTRETWSLKPVRELVLDSQNTPGVSFCSRLTTQFILIGKLLLFSSPLSSSNINVFNLSMELNLIFLSTFYFEAKYLKFIPSQPNIGIVSRS